MYNQWNQVRHPADADVVLVISDVVFVSLVVVWVVVLSLTTVRLAKKSESSLALSR